MQKEEQKSQADARKTRRTKTEQKVIYASNGATLANFSNALGHQIASG